jgi:hypothetical protein
MSPARPLDTFDEVVDVLRQVEGNVVHVTVGWADNQQLAPIAAEGLLSRSRRAGEEDTFFVGDAASFVLSRSDLEKGSLSLHEGWIHFSLAIHVKGFMILISEGGV